MGITIGQRLGSYEVVSLLSTPDAPDHLYAVDLISHQTRLLAPMTRIPAGNEYGNFPLAVTGEGQVLFDLPVGNMHRVVAAPRDGSDRLQSLLTLTEPPDDLEVGQDGSLYADLFDFSPGLLRYSPGDGRVEHIPLSHGFISLALPLADGRVLVPLSGAGRTRIMITAPGKDPQPFVQTDDETNQPMSTLGEDRVALVLGSAPNRVVATVSARDGRIVGRIPQIPGETVEALAGSPDGTRLFYVSAGAVWEADTGGGEPKKICPGDGVAVDASGQSLIVKLNERDDVRLGRVPLSGGAEQPIPIRSDFRLAPKDTFGPNAVTKDGRIAVRVVSRDSWYWPVGILDPRTGRIEVIPPGSQFDADMLSPNWAPDGRLVITTGVAKSSLWRFPAAETVEETGCAQLRCTTSTPIEVHNANP